jgi:NADP-dependent 3-hydroxy acid dehydrogenase YdfG
MRPKNAVITGASQGIGRAVSLQLARHGFHCVLAGRNPTKLDDVAGKITAGGGTAVCMQVDLADNGSIRSFASGLSSRIDGLDVLINCAGAYSQSPWESSSDHELTKLFETNVRGTFALTRELLPLLIRARGDIVFVNSTIVHGDGKGAGLYAATKHALKGLADSLRAEINAQGVRVLSVYPGRTATSMQMEAHAAEHRPYAPAELLQPEDVAQAIVACVELSDTAEVTELTIRPRHKPKQR